MLQNLKRKKTDPSDLELEIARVLDVLKNTPPTDEAYDKASDQYVKLTKLHSEITSKKRVSPDVAVGAATNLAGILLILNYEHAHVMTSKALSFVWKAVR